MPRVRGQNLLAFKTWPVTAIVCVAYVLVFTALLHGHHIVPPAPHEEAPVSGVNITQAWADLQHLSSSFHPYNSHTNDVVRQWLLNRIRTILEANNVQSEDAGSHDYEDVLASSQVTVYDDRLSNVTFAPLPEGKLSVYFEGSNIVLYIKGIQSPENSILDNTGKNHFAGSHGRHCTLVNAHFDSVSTGYGATDDGVGVITMLQLLAHYTAPGQAPRHCLVLLFNNGEEDYLNGARAFAQHPLADGVDAFLNLEGAGAGGRAAMFRSTDEDITKAYRRSPYPFGTAASADGFRQGLVRSQTDYAVFTNDLGYRGVDVAFIEPRSRYHTSKDSTKDTSVDSVWHMLSAALATTRFMTDQSRPQYQSKRGDEPVFFDLFGRTLGLIDLSALIDASAALLVVGPVLVVVMAFFIASRNKFYVFAGALRLNGTDPETESGTLTVHLGGRRGFFRGPVSIVLATAVTLAIAFVVSKSNPFIVYSIPYSVWSTLEAICSLIFWAVVATADNFRPTALQRLYVQLWLYICSWVLLLLAVVVEFRSRICGLYFTLFLNATTLVSLTICASELLWLPPKSEFVREVGSDHDRMPATESSAQAVEEDEESTESSPLLQSSRRRLGSQHGVTRLLTHVIPSSSPKNVSDQSWAEHLPTFFWIFQFVLLAPLNLIMIGQLGLFFTSALSQTLGDGANASTIYLAFGALSVLLVLPTVPFMHRVSSRAAVFLLLVCIGTFLYNLLAFPFSESNRLKVYFMQSLPLDDPQNNTVTLAGVDGYVQRVVEAMPSALGKDISCLPPGKGSSPVLTACEWNNDLLPNISHETYLHRPSNYVYDKRDPKSWLNVTTHRIGSTSAIITLSGTNTRACKLLFNRPITDYNITGAAPQNPRFLRNPINGTGELRLWSREWDHEWEVYVTWNDTRSQGVKAVCLWSDANDPATIPALTEVTRYMPFWSTVTKAGDGLVEGWKFIKLS